MPIYDYQCPACRHEFTATHKISEAAPKCPNCGGEVRKKLSAPAVHGSGKRPNPVFRDMAVEWALAGASIELGAPSGQPEALSEMTPAACRLFVETSRSHGAHIREKILDSRKSNTEIQD